MLADQSKELKDQRIELKAANANLAKARAELAEKALEARTAIEALEAERLAAEERANELEKRLAGIRREQKGLEGWKRTSLSQTNALRQRVAELGGAGSDLQEVGETLRRIEVLEKETADASARIRALDEERTALEKEVEDARNSVMELEGQLGESKAEYDALQSETERQIDERDGKIAMLEQERAETEKLFTEAVETMYALEKAKIEADENVDALEARVAALIKRGSSSALSADDRTEDEMSDAGFGLPNTTWDDGEEDALEGFRRRQAERMVALDAELRDAGGQGLVRFESQPSVHCREIILEDDDVEARIAVLEDALKDPAIHRDDKVMLDEEKRALEAQLMERSRLGRGRLR
jgi:DNA repair exonuclease SbcCD ATPase subunit